MIDPSLLDQLVDGELPEGERRDLLRQLDAVPGGWRLCAMAFLEAQCWKETLGGGVAVSVAEPPASREPLVPRQTASPRLRVLGTALAMAASFLIALAVGPIARGLWRTGSASPSQRGETWVAENDRGAAAPESVGPSRDVPPQVAADAPPAAIPPASSSTARTVTVAMPDGTGNSPRWIHLPVTEQERLDETWIHPSSTALPPQVREALQRAGWQVRQSRELFPVPMQDGRRVVVPVDEVEVRYVGNHGFQ